jgi:hypothetical protein
VILQVENESLKGTKHIEVVYCSNAPSAAYVKKIDRLDMNFQDTLQYDIHHPLSINYAAGPGHLSNTRSLPVNVKFNTACTGSSSQTSYLPG